MFNTPLKLFRLIPIVLLLAGCGLLIGAFLSYRSTTAFLETAVTATGHVIGYERHNDSDGDISYFPVITFTPNGDDEIEFTSSTGGSSREYAIGASVPLRYDPALPFNATIDSPVDIWIVTGVLGFLGVVFTLVGGGIFWLTLRGSSLNRSVFAMN